MQWFTTNRDLLREIRKVQDMFESLGTKVERIVSAADGMELVLDDVRAKLDAIIAGGGLSEDAKAKLVALEAALETETDDIINKTLAGTPAAPPPA